MLYLVAIAFNDGKVKFTFTENIWHTLALFSDMPNVSRMGVYMKEDSNYKRVYSWKNKKLPLYVCGTSNKFYFA